MKHFTKFIFSMALTVCAFTASNVIAQTPAYNNGPLNASSGNSIPLAYLTTGVKGQSLYPVGVFGSPPSGMEITKIYWAAYTGSTGSSTYSQLHISMKQANISSLSASTYETGVTNVFSSTSHTITYTGGNWFMIELQTPFLYDPTLPLLVEVNQLQSPFTNFFCALSTQGTPAGAYRNYSSSYNATNPSGAGAYMNAFGFDLQPSSNAPNDVGVTKIDSPSVFCDGIHNVVATVKNFGINQVDSFTVDWTVNGSLQTPVVVTNTLLDTFSGVNPNFTQVVLGSYTFTAGFRDTIVAWTSMPNNQVDTVNKNDTAWADKQPSLYGSFTIDPLGTGQNNYVNWTDLAKDLSDLGVCGPIDVLVAPGTYNEKVNFNGVKGTSSVNTVTFIPDTGGVVKLTSNPSGLSDNYIIKLSNTDWFYFSDIVLETAGSTYATCLEINGGSSHNTFKNIQFKGNATVLSSYTYVIYCSSAGNDSNLFENNDIIGGYYGIYFFGGGTTSTNTGNKWLGNRFTDAYIYGTYFYYSTDLKFNYNTIRSSRGYTSMYGFMSYYSYKAAEVIGNDININGYMALYLGYHEGNATSKPLISNNMLRVGQNLASAGYGIYCVNGGYCRIANNTVATDHSTYTYYGLYLSGGANSVYNNIFHDRKGYNSASYACMYVGGGFALIESDHNDFYTNRAMGYLNTTYTTLAAWQAATGFDLNSVTVNPAYTNLDTLRSCNDSLDGAGTPLAYVSDDFDHDGRHPTTPDIGADEWVGNKPGAYSAGPDAFVCEGKSAEIGLPVTGGTFMWNTADTTPVITVSGGGVYTVDMTSVCGGQHSDTVVVVDVTPTSVFNIVYSYRTGQFNNLSANGLSYMWVLHTSPKDTFYTKDLTHVFPDNGPYNVDLYVYNDCDTIMSSQTWNGHVGMGENDLASMISLMPNPASDVMTIRFSGLEGDVQLEMTNIQGQRVYSAIYNDLKGDASRIIDVSSLNKGMYIVRFTTDKDVISKQIVVQ